MAPDNFPIQNIISDHNYTKLYLIKYREKIRELDLCVLTLFVM